MNNETAADWIMGIIVVVSFLLWGWKVWQSDAVPDLAGIVALVGVIPVSKAVKVYIETRARNTADSHSQQPSKPAAGASE